MSSLFSRNVLPLGKTYWIVKEAHSLLTTLTTNLTNLITNLYVSTGLFGIILAMAIESCCIPLPSEIVMPLAGIMISTGKILSGTNHYFSIVLVAVAGAVGCLIGSIAAYGIGYSGGRPLMLKYGKYVLISQHDAEKADRFFQKWGSATAFFSRLLPVVRTYISLPAGISKMPFVKFCIYTFLGSLPWCLLLAYVGTLIGNNLGAISPYFHYLDIVIVAAVVILVALYIWRHVRNDRIARAEHVANPSTPAAPNQFASQPLQSLQSAQQPWGQQSQSPQPPQQFQQPWGQPPAQVPPQQPGWGPQPPPSQQPGWGQQPQSPQPPQAPTRW
jgi:membrane protein DedA with SNARE-associated domain